MQLSAKPSTPKEYTGRHSATSAISHRYEKFIQAKSRAEKPPDLPALEKQQNHTQ